MPVADLNELSVFVRVAQLGSFSAAARSLGMPVSTVSRKVAELESRLAVNLIKRTTRKLSLAEAGVAFYESCALHLQGIDAAEAALSTAKTELDGLLRITAPVGLGRGDFLDFISAFLVKHPKVQVDLAVTNLFVDLVGTQVDVAIRFGDLADSGVIAKRLGVSRRVLVASPDYLARRGAPRSPRELSSHDCILFISKTVHSLWSLQSGTRRAQVRVTGRVTANSLETVNEFVQRGHGIALLPEFYLGTGTSLSSLVRVLPGWTSALIPVHAVYVGGKFVPAKLQAFLADLANWKTALWQTAR